jgi:hypothetical protein
MADTQTEIDDLKAEIKAIKAKNLDWASNERILDIINTSNKRILALVNVPLASGKLPIIFTLHFNI